METSSMSTSSDDHHIRCPHESCGEVIHTCDLLWDKLGRVVIDCPRCGNIVKLSCVTRYYAETVERYVEEPEKQVLTR
jgi:hypothetical protein